MLSLMKLYSFTGNWFVSQQYFYFYRHIHVTIIWKSKEEMQTAKKC